MNKYDYIFFGFLAFWILETAFFGFNKTSMTGMEKMADSVSMVVMFYCMFQSICINLVKPVKIHFDFNTLEKLRDAYEETKETQN
jgi:hypothetical protein